MRLAVLGSRESWSVRELRRVAAGHHEIVPVTIAQVASTVSADAVTVRSGELDLAACEALLVRSMPLGSLEQVVFRMDVLAQAEAEGVVVINPARAMEAAVDKYLATARLCNAGLPVPSTIACQTTEDAMAAFDALGRDVVVKPLFGAEGRGITRISDEALAMRAFQSLERLGAVIYLQPFVEHEGFDLRLLVIGDEVLAIERRSMTDWRTNVSRGATARPWTVTDELADLARRAAAAIGAPLAGVDVLPGRDGMLRVLEVNAVPGWQALQQALQVDVAARVLTLVEAAVAKAAGRRDNE